MRLVVGNNGKWIVEGTTDTNLAKQFLAGDFIFITKAPDGTMLFKKAVCKS